MTDVVVPPQEPTGPDANVGPSLSHVSARGLAWMSANSLVSKVLGTISQIVLAWLLDREDFGLIGLTYTVAAIVGILSNTGLEDVLVQRHRHYNRWANPSFWIGMTSGGAATLAMIAAAPIAERVYHTHAIVGLTLLMSAIFPLANLALVPMAKLRIELRFRTLAGIGLAANMLQSLLTILLAWRGYGAYSFIWPRLIAVTFPAVVAWYLVRPPIRLHADFRLWRRLLGVGTSTFGFRVACLLLVNGDYLTLGLMYPATVVGIYYFAFNLSTQTMSLVVINFNNVLFPALCKLQSDVNRQARAMLRGLNALMAVATPCCLLQAALAGPGVHILFQPKWYPSIPVLEILSVGMVFSALAWPSNALLPAQGRFFAQANTAWIGCVLFFSFVIVGSYFKASVGAAIGVTAYFIAYAAIVSRVSLWPSDFGWKEIVASSQGSLISGAVAMGLASGARLMLPVRLQNGWLAIALVLAISVPLYCYCLRKTDAAAWQELAGRSRDLWARLKSVVNRGSKA